MLRYLTFAVDSAEPESSEVRECAQCHRLSNLPEAFTPLHRRREAGPALCPLCRALHRRRFALRLEICLRIATGAGIAAIAILSTGTATALSAWLLVVIGLYPLPVVMTAVHECIHAVVGRLAGARIYEVRIGRGDAIRSIVIRGTRWSLGKGIRAGGWCIGIFPDLRSRIAAIAFIGAPLLFHAALAAVLLPHSSLSAAEGSALVGLVDLVCAYNAWLALINIWPRDFQAGLEAMPTDGRQLFHLATAKDAVEEYRRTAPTYHCYYSALNGDHESAIRHAGDLDGEDPDDPDAVGMVVAALLDSEQFEAVETFVRSALEALPPEDVDELDEDARLALYLGNLPLWHGMECALAHALCRLDRVEEALEIYEKRLPRLDNGAIEAMYRNDLAHALIRYGRTPDRAQRAVELSAEASAALPWTGFVHGTKAMALIESGRAKEGLAALDEADALGSNPHFAATRSSYRALAFSTLGDQEKARQHLRIARLHGLEADLVDEIEARIGGAAPAPSGP